jgi:hypothetical protein
MKKFRTLMRVHSTLSDGVRFIIPVRSAENPIFVPFEKIDERFIEELRVGYRLFCDCNFGAEHDYELEFENWKGLYEEEHEEGGECPECKEGILYYPKVENCSCHIHPPCSACVNNVLTCPNCCWEEDRP